MPEKSVTKMLYQYLWAIGEKMIVKDTMNREVKRAAEPVFLKNISSRPNPITVKIAVEMSRPA